MSTALPLAAPSALEDDVRFRLFRDSRPGGAPPRIGMEVEVLPVDAASGRPCRVGGVGEDGGPDGPSVGDFLLAWGRQRGWWSGISPAGSPAVELPGGGALSFEPGGQLEYSTPPHLDLSRLFSDVTGVLGPMATDAADRGIVFVARGLDPVNSVAAAPLQIKGERYRRMARHYDRRGPAGRRMMRQSAAIHLNLDLGDRPRERWWAGNALAPVFTALFANSPRVEGTPSGHRSSRALQWRLLDPTRTGLQGRCPDPEATYLAFALEADAFLMGDEDEPARPLREWLPRGVTTDQWLAHLTTLFPEVRPRGYLELRCCDALPLRWLGAPAALAAGLLYDDRTLDEVLASFPPADGALLERAGRLGLADPDLATGARRALDLAEEGLGRLGPGWARPGRAALRCFREACADRSLDPGHHPADDFLA